MNTNKYILKDVNATGSGSPYQVLTAGRTFQLIGKTDSGSGAVNVTVQVTNDPKKLVWIDVGVIELVLGTSPSTDGFAIYAQWDYVRAVVNSISGTGAIIDLLMSNERS